MSDPIEPMKNIGKRLQEIAADIGLELHTFAVMPDFDGTSHMVQAVFSIGELPVAVDDDQAEIDATLAEMVRAEQEAEKAAKANETRDNLLAMRQRLDAGLPIIDDSQ